MQQIMLPQQTILYHSSTIYARMRPSGNEFCLTGAARAQRAYKQALFLFCKGTAGCLMTIAGAVARNVYMLCMAFVIAVIFAVVCFTVDADCLAGMLQCADISITGTLSGKAFTAGIILFLRMLSAYHNIALTAVFSLIVYTVFHTTFQLSHRYLSFQVFLFSMPFFIFLILF